MKGNDKGFSLFEVLIAMFITGVALIGLAKMDIYILKSSQASFNYTVATIKANDFVDTVWIKCNASSSSSTYGTIRSDWVTELGALNMSAAAANPPAAYASDAEVTVSWSDLRFTDDAANNSVTLSVKFPNGSCG